MVMKLARLSSGLVIAGAYADKIRRTAFAQLRDLLKEGSLKSEEVAQAIAQLNRLLYNILVEGLKLDKGDVVRIVVEYEVDSGKLNWKLETLKIEAFKRVSEEIVKRAVESGLSKAESLMTGIVEYTLEKLGETEDGDIVLAVKLGNREVGTLVVTPINEEFVFIKKAAIVEPSPLIVEKQKIPLEGKAIEEALRSNIGILTTAARYVTDEEARRLYEALKRKVIPTATVERIEEFEMF